MLHLNCVLAILVAMVIDKSCSVVAEKGKFEPMKPSTIASLPDERRSVNFKERSEETSNKRQLIENENDTTQDPRQEKKIRTLGGLLTEGGDNHRCCGSRYDVSSPGRPESSQGGNGGSSKGSSDNGRYPSRYGSRPEDRFGWQSYTPGTSGRRGSAGSTSGSAGSGGGLYGSQSGGDRYGGSRPSYYGGDNEYDRPSNSGNRPGRPSYGYGGNGYGDSGAYGSNGYEISRPGGYGGGGNRPPGGINFGGGRPGGGSYGGGSYGGGGQGVYGTIGEQDEFPGQEEGAEPPGPPHPGVNNLQTQKAVALKALAGVALIGAAAALASNPVLLPISVLAGRRKRSVHSSSEIEDVDVGELLKLLEDIVPKIYRERIKKETLNSPTCVARLACEIQRANITEENKSTEAGNSENIFNRLRKRMVKLIQSKALDSEVHHKNIRKLMKSAEAFNGNCNVFICDFIKN